MSTARHHPAAIRAAERAAAEFAKRRGRRAQWVGVAPGRTNLIGEHTDYSGGFVMPLAIDRYCAVAAGPVEGMRGRIVSTDLDVEMEFEGGAAMNAGGLRGHPLSYVLGVMAGFEALGVSAVFDLVVASEVPIGAGLSSSAALEVATASVIEAATGRRLEPRVKALLCQRAEHEFAGVPCGIMDQLTSVKGEAGRALLIDCRSLEVQSTRMLPEDEIAVVVVDTRVRHALADGMYARRREACERAARALGADVLRDVDPAVAWGGQHALDEEARACAAHVIQENERVMEMAACFERGAWAAAGERMFASHESLREGLQVSCEELDFVVEVARTGGGVFGAKMSGAGFGGCVVALIGPAGAARFGEVVSAAYRARFGRECAVCGVRASPGCAAWGLDSAGS